MYKIIGADQKQYGPISGDQIRQWISEGRVNGQTMACAEGSDDWKPISEFPEFGFTATPVPAATPPSFTGPMTREEIIARDYSIDIMSCFSRGWKLYKENFGVMFVTFLLFALFFLASFVFMQLILKTVGVTDLPMEKQGYFRLSYVIFGSLLLGPAMGGVYHVYLSLMRDQPATAGDIFTGFKSYFQDLFIGKLILSAFTTACTFPYLQAMTVKMAPIFERIKEHPQQVDPNDFSGIIAAYTSPLPLLLIGMIPLTYLFVSFCFTFPLIVDKPLGFWNALGLSWRMVHKHWFHIFGLVVLVSILNIPGGCLCYVGLLFTMPLGLAALCYAYEDIFGRQNA
jgi:hypothetical protein